MSSEHQRRLEELNGSRQTVTERQSKLAALKAQAQRARLETDRVLEARDTPHSRNRSAPRSERGAFR